MSIPVEWGMPEASYIFVGNTYILRRSRWDPLSGLWFSEDEVSRASHARSPMGDGIRFPTCLLHSPACRSAAPKPILYRLCSARVLP